MLLVNSPLISQLTTGEIATSTLPGAGRSRDQARQQGFRAVVAVVKGVVVVTVVVKIVVN
jgi:hypothetical protein